MHAKTPPGPVNFNAAFGLTWRHYWRLRSNPVKFATRLSQQYGDITFFRIFWHRAFLVNHPELIRQILVSEADNFPKFGRIREHLRQATGDGLLVTEGDQWRKQRLSAQKIFRSGRLNLFADLTSRYTSSMIDAWSSRRSVQIEHEMTSLVQAIMAKGFFGVEPGPADEIAEAVRVYSDIFHHESRATFNLPDSFPISFKRQKRDSIALIRRVLTDVVIHRIQTGKRRDDFLDLLLYSNEDQPPGSTGTSLSESFVEGITSQLLTMYIAGFHTTSVALAWLFFAVASDFGVQKRLRNEIGQVCGQNRPSTDHLGQLQYHDMVVRESLRLYPAAWELFARRAKRDTELAGYHVPAKSLVFIMPIVTHRDPRFFPDPLTFDPTRFGPDRSHEIPAYGWIPFGAGPRHCIGKPLVLMQMSLILATVLQQFSLRPARGQTGCVDMVPGVSARPAGDITLQLHRQSLSTPSTDNSNQWNPLMSD